MKSFIEGRGQARMVAEATDGSQKHGEAQDTKLGTTQSTPRKWETTHSHDDTPLTRFCAIATPPPRPWGLRDPDLRSDMQGRAAATVPGIHPGIRRDEPLHDIVPTSSRSNVERRG